MENRFFDEKNGLWYEKQGDYYWPCLLSEEEQQSICVWGQRHLRYIKQNRKVFYANLLTSGKLNAYIADIDEHATGGKILAAFLYRLSVRFLYVIIKSQEVAIYGHEFDEIS